MLENLLSLEKIYNEYFDSLDLSKEEDYKKFKDAIKSIREVKEQSQNNPVAKFICLFIDDNLLDDADEFADDIYNKSLDKKESCSQCQNPCIDCEEEYCDGCKHFESHADDEKKFVMPSELLNDTNVKLQIHHLVAEYCDEYIKPYVDDKEKGNELANNAYAGLYEFACWIFNHK